MREAGLEKQRINEKMTQGAEQENTHNDTKTNLIIKRCTHCWGVEQDQVREKQQTENHKGAG